MRTDKKQDYQAPRCEALTLAVEGTAICASGGEYPLFSEEPI